MMKVLHILFNYGRPLNTFPSVYNALYLWHKNGYENHIATSANCDEFKNIIHRHYLLNGRFIDEIKCISSMHNSFDIIIVYSHFDVELFYLSQWKKHFKFETLLHHSLEIPTAYYNGLGRKRLYHRILLRFAMPKVNKLIIQDETRLRLFLTYFPSLINREYFIVPNSYINTIEPISQSLEWFDHLRDNAKYLVLYTGAIERWALSLNLFDQLKKLEHITFLFSGWSDDGFGNEIIRYCLDSRNIHFHLGIKTRSELNYMVSNSDIGLLWYNSQTPNVTCLGMSSGKFHKYLSYKKPIIINRLPPLSDYIYEKGIGISSEIDKIYQSIYYLIDNYSILQDNIEKNYSGECDFESHYIKVIDSIYHNLRNH